MGWSVVGCVMVKWDGDVVGGRKQKKFRLLLGRQAESGQAVVAGGKAERFNCCWGRINRVEFSCCWRPLGRGE
jgi:hypothetical protein